MSDNAARRFPSGRLVVVLLVASGVLWAVLGFITVPHLRQLAGGAAPFDLRWSGYSDEDARAFLAAIGESGRAYYLNPELVLDTIFPPLYAVSFALAFWWLTMPGRLWQGAVPLPLRWALVALSVVTAMLDGVENLSIARMIWAWPDLSAGVVRVGSLATQSKLMAATTAEILLVLLAAMAALRRMRRAGA